MGAAMRDIDPADIISVHVFYNAPDLRPLIVNCIDPLVARLRREALIAFYFFIRYWEGGPHVRLRVLPVAGVPESAVTAVIDVEVASYLDKNPSMFDLDPGLASDVMRSLFEFEYGKTSYLDRFGPDGKIALRDNNSFAYIAYVPEYDRYGGPHGIAIAHDVFQQSSDIVLDVLRGDNSRYWDRITGVAFQFMLHFAYAVYRDRTKLVDFFHFYAARLGDMRLPADLESQLEQYFSQRTLKISRYVEQLDAFDGKLEAAGENPLNRMVGLAKAAEREVMAAAAAGQLVFNRSAVSGDEALQNLMVNYIHMTNNRLGVRSFEELKLAKLIARSLVAAE